MDENPYKSPDAEPNKVHKQYLRVPFGKAALVFLVGATALLIFVPKPTNGHVSVLATLAFIALTCALGCTLGWLIVFARKRRF